MNIKTLVLDNFKSFGRKTRIPFYEDFTTVSGPNGSGKSNIIDAVLFALGLARTRGIRARKLTDLIYNPAHDDGGGVGGTREASVAVVLDNEDGTLTRAEVESAAGTEDVGDVDEITIKRRVKQTEDNYYSYYYINGRSVNLADIQDLLAQAGVTPEGYNVVMQGDVTGIINMTAGERREIIDEIAGVAAFDAKKEDAFEELEVVEGRIEEAELRIEEKEERLEQLEDERETALEYQAFRDEKEEYESYRKAAELEEKREALADTREEIDVREDEIEELRRELDEREGRVSRLESDLDDLNTEIERKGEDEQLAIKREIEEVKGEIGRLEDKIETAEERIEDAENERRQAFVEIDRKQETVDELESDIRQVKVEKSSIATEIEDLEDDLAEVEAEIEATDTAYDELKADLAEQREALEAEKSAKNEKQREQDRLLDAARRRSNEQSETETELDEARERIPEIEAAIGDLEDEREKAATNEENIEDVVADLKTEKRERNEDLDEVEEELRAAQQKYADLEAKTDESGSSYGRAVSTVLNADLDGVHGTIAQLGGVDPEHATACETAAGGRLAHVVVDDDGVGERAIEYLKSRNAGRATFLPLTEMQQRSLPRLPDRDGVVDFAANLVDYPKEYAGVFSYVLGSTLVVEEMATARELMGDYRLVTLEGELVEKSGAMTGGSKSGSRYSFGSSEGRLKRVADRVAELEEERREAKEAVRDVEGRLDDARERRSAAAEQVREVEADIEAKEREREEVEERIASLESEINEIESAREEVDEEMGELESAIADHDDRIEEIESEIAELEGELADSDVPELTEKADAIEGEIDDREDRMDDLDGRLNELQLEKEYAEDSIDDLHTTLETAQNRKAENEERIEELEAEIEECEATLDEKEAAVAELEDELAELKEDRAELKEELQDARAARDEQKEMVDEAEDALEDRRETAERLDWEIDELAAAVGEYDADEIPDHDEVEREISRIEGAMEELEPVNMLAIDEYDAVEDDLADLTDKKATLTDERDGIEERIESYEAQKKSTFMESYEAINDQFESIFERLSAGSGTLHLEDPEDPFEGGLTMKAQPGDKPIQRLDAMSGGEKSLTALAFIFAIQRHNPAPFYALDEVDAFLDAANAERVGELVDELAADAQFIVVSHRSAMLERSERAIGVTMQGDNISAVTGIELGAQEVPADD
ncbi:chromosome segregation protein SMC [Halococcus saccharolyticus]|uniref:Chromosome partition protein Smc n=1 Tax=Halococcus saccharolyticus DSM 5350 TaxID=1227455 RepID=M0MM32_9EURY|nr:chromosome segregation protein SMC [Halococcus saccharolyticus]EMA46752.1 chromosome segregation protein SMC [Halococcus saccharolyticus DSM 5350]